MRVVNGAQIELLAQSEHEKVVPLMPSLRAAEAAGTDTAYYVPFDHLTGETSHYS